MSVTPHNAALLQEPIAQICKPFLKDTFTLYLARYWPSHGQHIEKSSSELKNKARFEISTLKTPIIITNILAKVFSQHFPLCLYKEPPNKNQKALQPNPRPQPLNPNLLITINEQK